MKLRCHRITTALTGNQNNYALDDAFDYFSLSLGIAPVFTGFTGYDNTGGRVVYLVNSGGNDIDIAHQDTNSSEANRIITPSGATYTLTAGTTPEIVQLVYDPFASRWRMRLGG